MDTEMNHLTPLHRDPKFDPRLLQRYARLMDQELWLIGQDIMSPGGNLLISYGCTLTRSGTHGRRYVHVDGLTNTYIWAFGVGHECSELRVLAPRHSCDPTLITDQALFVSVSSATDPILDTLTPGYRTPDERLLLIRGVAEVARWMSRYEQWIYTHHNSHRTCTLLARKRPIGTPSEMSALWQILAEDISVL